MFTKRHQLLCPSLAAAKRNRQRVANGEVEPFYLRQARLCACWELGTLKPAELVLGELPQVINHNHKLSPETRTLIR